MLCQHRTIPRQPDHTLGSRTESWLDHIHQVETTNFAEGQISESHKPIDPGGSVLGRLSATR